MTLERILLAAKNSMITGHHEAHCYSAHVPGHGYTNDGTIEETRADYLRQLARSAQMEIDNLTYANGYAEPGYQDPARGVVFANWNVFPRGLDSILETAGYAVEWSDEWSICEDCQRAFRTSPDSYGWRASYVWVDECTLVCSDCACKDLDAYEDTLRNETDKADTLDVDWASRGYTRLNAEHYESGLHPGQNDRPSDIAKQVPPGHDFLFAVPTVGQFDVSFDCWIRPVEETDND